MLKRLLLSLAIFLLPVSARAQLWSGIVDPSRAVDWSTVGVIGGIPTTRTQCVTTQCNTVSSGTTVTAASVQAALNSAPASTYILIPSGTFTMNTGVTIPSNVTLRGNGANLTFLNFSGQGAYYWGSYDIGMIGNYTGGFETHPPGMSGSQSCTGSVGPPPAYGGCTQLVQWTGTNGSSGVYTKGATVLNLASVPGTLTVGETLNLTQADDQAVVSVGPMVCQITKASNGCSREGQGLTYDNTAQRQMVKVTAINGTAVTVTPGIYADYWVTTKNPVAFWWTNDIRAAGLENLTVHETFGNSSSLWSSIAIFNASDSWVKGVALTPHNGPVGGQVGTRYGILVHDSRNITIQDNWLDNMFGGGSSSTTSYGMSNIQSSAVLWQNNILRNVESPIITTGGVSGDVYAYNYDPAVCTPGTGCTGLFLGHDEGGMFYLFEGNIGPLFRKDSFHGDEQFVTMYRNRLTGNEVNSGSNNMEPNIDIYALSRYYNVVANVLGNNSGASVSTIYQCVASAAAGCDRYGPSIYRLGYPGESATAGAECEGSACLNTDSQVPTTLMRWGNWDVVTNAVRWCGNSSNTGWSTTCASTSEVPTGIPDHSNAVPTLGDTGGALPASFYLSSKPSWVAPAKPWPLIGPDVTGGNIANTGGHANTIPAQDCYTSVSATVANFNAATCYAASGSTPIVSLAPTSVAFANQAINSTSAEQTITLTNTGTATLNITSISLTGVNAANFGTLNNTCGSTLNAGFNCTIQVTFSPLAVQGYSANLTFTTNAPSSPDNVSLTGTGAQTGTVTGIGQITGAGTITAHP